MQEIFTKSVEELRSFPGDAAIKNLSATVEDARDMGSIPGLERSLQGGNGNPFQYSCLENSKDYGAWGLQSLGSQKNCT